MRIEVVRNLEERAPAPVDRADEGRLHLAGQPLHELRDDLPHDVVLLARREVGEGEAQRRQRCEVGFVAVAHDKVVDAPHDSRVPLDRLARQGEEAAEEIAEPPGVGTIAHVGEHTIDILLAQAPQGAGR